jgi:hypothetical protein
MLIYLVIIASIAAWRFLPRPWHPTTHRETDHYAIASTATPQQTTAMGDAAERLYRGYARLFGKLPKYQANHPRLKMLLYKDRDEMRYINPGMGWAEAFYKKPYCRAFYSAGEANPFHWMLHESVHQLNQEVANLHLEKWLDEGLAEYLSTSRIRDGELLPGTIDPYTYPTWWISKIAEEGDLARDLANGSVIPLRAIIEDNGPNMDANVNLYYLHWWTLAHFVFEKHPQQARELLAAGGTLEAFERLIGPIETIQPKWHAHVLRMKNGLHDSSPHFQATGEVPPE